MWMGSTPTDVIAHMDSVDFIVRRKFLLVVQATRVKMVECAREMIIPTTVIVDLTSMESRVNMVSLCFSHLL